MTDCYCTTRSVPEPGDVSGSVTDLSVEAIEAHSRARDIFPQLGDAHGEATAWNNLGNALHQVQREQEAREAFERAVQGFRATGDEHRLTVARGNLTRLRQRP
ncbi:tetratricopeptide repeat protein [Nocardiopsis sp. NPDC006198]|uniref:tetratricopeptide repeat protein n=1 Tax=Nocardiopsis sp. NPDC006198 TaxID=3154472 RepID=UPI0033BD851E